MAFSRIHKSYLVNLECITEIFPWTRNGLALKLKGYENTVLPVGKRKAKDFKTDLKHIIHGPRTLFIPSGLPFMYDRLPFMQKLF